MKVYLIGDAEHDELEEVVETFEEAGHETFMGATDNADLRGQIQMLIGCQGVCLLEGWWYTREGVCLQTLAAWLKMKVFDTAAHKIPTSSLKG